MNNELIDSFKQIFIQHSSIRLLNIYKGLPISNEAEITGIDRTSIVVTSLKSQIACMYLDRESFIQGPELPGLIRAKVLELFPASLEVRLGNFEYVRGGLGERQQVRVEPIEAINSLVQPKNYKTPVQAELADISQNGLAIYLPARYFLPEIYRVGTEITIHLSIPEGANTAAPSSYQHRASDPMSRFSRENIRGAADLTSSDPLLSSRGKKEPIPASGKQVSVQAVIKNIKTEIKNNRIRIGMRIYAHTPELAVITSFISQRQSEIIREVKTLSELLNKFK